MGTYLPLKALVTARKVLLDLPRLFSDAPSKTIE